MGRSVEIMPGIILEYLAYLGIRELCGNNCTRVLRAQSRLGIATCSYILAHRRRMEGPELVDETIEGEGTSSLLTSL